MTVLNTGIQFVITAGFLPLGPEGAGALESVEVSTSLVRPGRALITFADPARTLLKSLRLSLGDPLAISAIVDTEFAPIPLLDGEIVGFESTIGGGGSQTTVVVLDPLHKLQRSVESHTYRFLPISAIVRQVALRNGLLAGQVDDRGFPTAPVTNQFHETDFDFLSDLAAKVGVSLFWRNRMLHFASPASASDGPKMGMFGASDPLLIVREADLLRGHVSVSTVGASAETNAVGWDMLAKQPLNGSSSVDSDLVAPGEKPSQIAGTTTSTPAAGRAFASSQAALDHAAQVHAERIGDRTAELELMVEGRPQLQAGEAVTVAGLEDPFDGSYVITEATHRYGPHLGYTTEVHVTGLEDRSLGAFTAKAQPSHPLMKGLVPGIVSANRDILAGAYRVKVKFPWLGDDIETDWLQVMAAGAGPGRGISFLPEIDDEVLVAFQAGDHRQPVVVGSVYNGQDKPPVDVNQQVGADGQVVRRSIVSRLGHEVVLIDAMGEESIEVTTADGSCQFKLNQSGRKIEITSMGDLSLQSGGNLTLEAGGELKLTAARNAELAAAMNTKIKGLRIDLN